MAGSLLLCLGMLVVAAAPACYSKNLSPLSRHDVAHVFNLASEPARRPQVSQSCTSSEIPRQAAMFLHLTAGNREFSQDGKLWCDKELIFQIIRFRSLNSSVFSYAGFFAPAPRRIVRLSILPRMLALGEDFVSSGLMSTRSD
ncbi:hypothetical protein BD410DRAFT_845751 [Rickenella mellea]|uniref:Uncharacterized protein n=1 Tax=Rickenella mellea TaxID=50990 RepID=A0A4Y7PIU9_9AGAM|nr:hypothetical protein BD410DRAFT_845751 [Rickenella mellea]